MARFLADALIRGALGDPIAVVEIKNRENLTQDVAIQLRRNLLVHGMLPNVPYFLLVSQDVGFL